MKLLLQVIYSRGEMNDEGTAARLRQTMLSGTVETSVYLTWSSLGWHPRTQYVVNLLLFSNAFIAFGFSWEFRAASGKQESDTMNNEFQLGILHSNSRAYLICPSFFDFRQWSSQKPKILHPLQVTFSSTCWSILKWKNVASVQLMPRTSVAERCFLGLPWQMLSLALDFTCLWNLPMDCVSRWNVYLLDSPCWTVVWRLHHINSAKWFY